MCFDQCTAFGCKESELRKAVERTIAWASVCKDSHSNDKQMLFGIVQGGIELDLRAECASELVKLDFDGSTFALFYHTYDERLFQTHIDRFYKKEAEKFIPSCVEEWAEKMSLSPTQIRFRKTKRQWGSCSAKDVLCFNTMMLKLPENVIQYIIVHELAHIKHKHHQKDFWQLVESYLPQYKLQVKELKNYTT